MDIEKRGNSRKTPVEALSEAFRLLSDQVCEEVEIGEEDSGVWTEIESVVESLARTRSQTIQDCLRKLHVVFAFMDESDWPERRLLGASIADLQNLTGA